MNLGKGIVSTSSWIYAKDGNQYRAFFGKCSVLKAEETIGCRTGSGQADFVIKIEGKSKDWMIISGCEFKGFQICDELPPTALSNIFSI